MPSALNTLRLERPTARSLGDIIDAGASRLAEAGVREPRRQAAAMWAWLAGTTVGQVWLERPDAPRATLVQQFLAAVERRIVGEPLPYVVGKAGFRTLELEVDANVLIPRPETEGLVEQVLTRAARAAGWRSVVDIGTGSGCVALSLAVEGGFGRVVATDISEAALAVARRNVERVAPSTPVEIREGSLWKPLHGDRFDVIVSNPPYVSETEFETLEPSVRQFEPRLALVSPEGGMEHIRRLLEGAREFLLPRGLLALEVDSGRAEAARTLAMALGWGRVWIEQDLFRRPRYLLATREP